MISDLLFCGLNLRQFSECFERKTVLNVLNKEKVFGHDKKSSISWELEEGSLRKLQTLEILLFLTVSLNFFFNYPHGTAFILNINIQRTASLRSLRKTNHEIPINLPVIYSDSFSIKTIHNSIYKKKIYVILQPIIVWCENKRGEGNFLWK